MNLPPRSLALDVLRGMTVALMIVVNMSIGDASYAPLMHAQWNGLTLTDMVFPTFLFVSGASLAWTLARMEADGERAFLVKVARRTALIFLAGYLLYWFPFFRFGEGGGLELLPIANTRIPGVLQRIALCHGIAALVLHYGRERWAMRYCIAVLPAYWWALTAFGDLSLPGNAVIRLDRWVLGESHMYGAEGIPFDPEGILSTFPAVANVLGGFFAARLIRDKGSSWEALARLLLCGMALILLALTWNAWFPINKKLWTSSYVLCTVGIDLCVLAMLSWLLDIRLWRHGTAFFCVFGRNPLVLYLLAEILQIISWHVQVGGRSLFDWAFQEVYRPFAGPANGALLFAMTPMMICWVVGWVMDRRKVYVRF